MHAAPLPPHLYNSVQFKCLATTIAMMDPEPIPLRTLTVLLNYERVMSDPRFEGVRLTNSSFANPILVPRTQQASPRAFATVPSTVQKTNLHFFQAYQKPQNADLTFATCLVHPNAPSSVKALNDERLESIYYETRGHDGCYKAARLYEHFFKIEACPPNQKISIQITNEEPVLITSSSHRILELKIGGPKLNSLFTVTKTQPPDQRTFNTGIKDNEPHAVVVFFDPQHPADLQHSFVVDMSRLQYGNAGRGVHSENYFLGTVSDFRTSMRDICVNLHEEPALLEACPAQSPATEKLLRACAEKVWERWQKRETEGWCAFCGKPEPNLKKCSACKTKNVFYCCAEHQKYDEKLHNFTCEKIQK